MPKPSPETYPAFFHRYVSNVAEEDLVSAFENQRLLIREFLNTITEEKSSHGYAPGKWTLKELLQHVIDTERIFNYRALCFSRKESASLPGFEENEYAANSNANRRLWNDMVAEFISLRESTECLYKSFNTEMLGLSGKSDNKPTTVNSIGFITIGHFYHHKKIIKERYLT